MEPQALIVLVAEADGIGVPVKTSILVQSHFLSLLCLSATEEGCSNVNAIHFCIQGGFAGGGQYRTVVDTSPPRI